MTSKELSRARQHLRDQNRNYTKELRPFPREQWPADETPNRIAVYRSKDFMVQIFQEREDLIRLTINRTDIDKDGFYRGDLTWEELQWIKDKCGYQDVDAVEVYPAHVDIVTTSNLRHLWVFTHPLEFVWRQAQ